MKSGEKPSSLTIEREAGGTIAVTGSVDPEDDAALTEALEAARSAQGDVVMILTHATPEKGERGTADQSTEAVVASLRAIAQAVAQGLERRESIAGLIEQMSPLTVPSPPAVLQARRNSEARQALFEEFEALTATDVADLAGSAANNRSALAARWRKEGRVLAVSNRGQQYYPAFQFGDDFRPLPVISNALASLRREPMSDWEVALWFTTRNGWLGDRRPVDLLGAEPAAVEDAAVHEVEPIAG